MLTKETISGKEYNVVWHDALGHMGKPHWMKCQDGFTGISSLDYDCIATALPPLPRYPKPEHQRLLHLYASHGVDVYGTIKHNTGVIHNTFLTSVIHLGNGTEEIKITSLTYNNQRIDSFAVEENE
jgi:hypothetical protein